MRIPTSLFFFWKVKMKDFIKIKKGCRRCAFVIRAEYQTHRTTRETYKAAVEGSKTTRTRTESLHTSHYLKSYANKSSTLWDLWQCYDPKHSLLDLSWSPMIKGGMLTYHGFITKLTCWLIWKDFHSSKSGESNQNFGNLGWVNCVWLGSILLL